MGEPVDKIQTFTGLPIESIKRMWDMAIEVILKNVINNLIAE